MSGILKALLLVAVLVCVSRAQLFASEKCLCRRTRGFRAMETQIKDLHIYPQTVFCRNVEIVVTLKNDNRFCLNPQLPVVRRLMERMLKRKQALHKTTPAALSSTASTQSTSQS
ncbi:growth-regulated alpha protein-like [Nelusetta ayraudi]|uniref:growth-regulated alpha protein-like n=1 Tax=Nelusetta ayraudi TaxID=303726 RepID=UPI003F6E8BDC